MNQETHSKSTKNAQNSLINTQDHRLTHPITRDYPIMIMVRGYDLRLSTHVSIKMQEYCTNKRPSSSSKDIDILNPKSLDFKPMLFLIV